MRRETHFCLAVVCLLAAAAPASAQTVIRGTPGKADSHCPSYATEPLIPAVQNRSYTLQLFNWAQVFNWTNQGISVPRGLTLSDKGTFSGKPLDAGDQVIIVPLIPVAPCPWTGPDARFVVAWHVKVIDAQVPVVSDRASPDTLAPDGGSVAVSAQISDNVGVVKANTSLTRPNGTSTVTPLTLASGDPKSGTWVYSWTIPANGTGAAVTYTVKTWALDAQGNEGRGSARNVVVKGKAAGPDRVRPTH